MICLNMIVKNEAPVIRLALESVVNHIDCWYVSDTGSTDGTQEIIQEILGHLPGRLEQANWVNFAVNRTMAMRRAEELLVLNARDYHLILDADDALDFRGDTASLASLIGPAELDYPDAYNFTVRTNSIAFQRTHLLSASGKWCWRCPVHEYMHHVGPCNIRNLDHPVYLSLHGGNRSKDPTTYQKDAEMLERAIQHCAPEDQDLVPRMTFYLAQSYRDAKQPQKAINAYTVRYQMLTGYAQERYVSCLELAALDPTSRVMWYRKAFEIDPSRIEAPFWLAKHFFPLILKEADTLLWATYAASLTPRHNVLFGHPEMYDWAKNLLALVRSRLEGTACR